MGVLAPKLSPLAKCRSERSPGRGTWGGPSLPTVHAMAARASDGKGRTRSYGECGIVFVPSFQAEGDVPSGAHTCSGRRVACAKPT
jgi:hypothetical protein